MSKANKPYTYLELAYKDESGRVSGRKVMPFGESKPVFETLSNSQVGEVFHITSVQNTAGFWDWIKASKDTSIPGATTPITQVGITRTPTQAGKVLGSNYETPEERAKKQVFIIRQSSITAALSYLNNKAKSVSEVLQIAKEFENHVLFIDKPAATQGLIDMENDIPL
ncbi:MAG: hypothetical protein NUV97_02705 [archaeon]|nr:hypothetical protein [archaeon]